jgi:hypothetical protein
MFGVPQHWKLRAGENLFIVRSKARHPIAKVVILNALVANTALRSLNPLFIYVFNNSTH